MAKLFGLIVGYLAGRLPGAIIGFLIGWFIDSLNSIPQARSGSTGKNGDPFFVLGPTDFGRSLVMLCAAVMRADGKVMRSELDYAKAFFTRQFGEQYTQQMLLVLRDTLSQQIPLDYVCSQISHNMRYEVRLQLIHVLFGLANADGDVSVEETKVITHISRLLGIQTPDLESLKAMFHTDVDSDYKILEITSDATDEEVKKAYRRMAVKYHPDKLTQMGEEFQKAGQEKFLAVQQAYERLRKKRGFN